MPFFRRSAPLRGDIPQRQVNELRGRLVAREVALVPDRLADLTVQTLDGIRCVPDFAQLQGEHETGDHFLPAPAAVNVSLPPCRDPFAVPQ